MLSSQLPIHVIYSANGCVGGTFGAPHVRSLSCWVHLGKCDHEWWCRYVVIWNGVLAFGLYALLNEHDKGKWRRLVKRNYVVRMVLCRFFLRTCELALVFRASETPLLSVQTSTKPTDLGLSVAANHQTPGPPELLCNCTCNCSCHRNLESTESTLSTNME